MNLDKFILLIYLIYKGLIENICFDYNVCLGNIKCKILLIVCFIRMLVRFRNWYKWVWIIFLIFKIDYVKKKLKIGEILLK